jgi:hypothetical protein
MRDLPSPHPQRVAHAGSGSQDRALTVGARKDALPEKAATARVESMTHVPPLGLAVRGGRVRVAVVTCTRLTSRRARWDGAGRPMRVWLTPLAQGVPRTR